MSDHTDVGDFHCKFELDHTTCSKGCGRTGPRPWDDELVKFRTKFLHEELKEFEDAVAERDHAKIFDALIDLVYVAHGTAHLLGYPWRIGWDAVQAANMAKQRAAKDGSDSVRGSSFDVVKPASWIPPDIEGVLQAYGFDVAQPVTS